MSKALLAKGLLLHCRAGFAQEVVSEAATVCGEAGFAGFARVDATQASVRFALYEPAPWQALLAAAQWSDWVFARERSAWITTLSDLPATDRAGFIASALAELGLQVSSVRCEFEDTNAGKEVSGFLNRFQPHLEKALLKTGVLKTADKLPMLHLFFADSAACEVGLSVAGDAAPWPMGVPRLRMPRGAPSRSTLKLAEAFYTLLSEAEREKTLRAGLSAVDLGAAPGGWTLQLAQRGIFVTAIDNGPLAESVMETGLVTHLRADGFTWRPAKPVDWLVCDMVEQPARVAALIADWVATGRCRRSIFNLKLPMKKRFAELGRCRELIAQRLEAADKRYTLRMKHLYHDREEVTVYLALR